MRTFSTLTILVCLLTGSADAAMLSWDANAETNLAGYLLSYGTTPGQYVGTIDVGNVTSFQFVEPNPTVRYYLALRAYNTAGAIGAYSNEVVTTPATVPLTLTAISANRTSPQPVGTTITLAATATGGTTPYQFKWWIVNGTTSTVGQNWSTSSTFTWTPTFASAAYKIRVWARNASSTADAPDSASAVLESSWSITSAVTNQAPTVGAGSDKTITLPNWTTMNGTASDDGQPVPPGKLTLTWTKVSGPGTVTFDTPSAATTNASFSAAGTYVLRLTAFDGQLTKSDDAVRVVNPAVGGTGTGLTGQYYNDTATGSKFRTLVLTRTDSTVNFNWANGQPAPQVQIDNFSVRWTGQILAPATGNYTFTTVSDDGVRLWINGQRIINNWTNHAAATNTSTSVALSAGQRYTVRLEYYERSGQARVEFRWTPPGQVSQVIPASQLFP